MKNTNGSFHLKKNYASTPQAKNRKRIKDALKQRGEELKQKELKRKTKENELKRKQKVLRATIKPTQKVHGTNDFERSFGCEYEIFAYCSENYKDAYDFVIGSWLRPNVTKVTMYTDFDFKPKDSRVEVIPMFKGNKSKQWIVGTGRRLDIINDFSKRNYNSNKNVLFLDIDCYITDDISHVFSKQFDIGITRLFSNESHTCSTATAGLWFARMNKNYQKFIDDWTIKANEYKRKRRGIREHHISYVQYSFTDVARLGLKTKKYDILAIDENFYNSEHSSIPKWLQKIKKYPPLILHYKGKRFRDIPLIKKTLNLAGVTDARF